MRIPSLGGSGDTHLMDFRDKAHNCKVTDRLGIPCCREEMFFWWLEITPGHELFHSRTRLGHHGELAAKEVSRRSKGPLY